ncbi:uncharacterized protein METZ01_LOCUS187957 [marine metagenome]|uniref:Uncharacterized protein n=1 Tax=marine metagenome TaxID=408172 RepID=A0A382DBV2_9ZZZZ
MAFSIVGFIAMCSLVYPAEFRS